MSSAGRAGRAPAPRAGQASAREPQTPPRASSGWTESPLLPLPANRWGGGQGHGAGRPLAHGHAGWKRQAWDLDPGRLTQKPVLIPQPECQSGSVWEN